MSKKITITLYKSEIIYEIQNKAFLTGLSRLTNDNAPTVATMQVNDQEADMNQIMRSIGNAYAILKTKLSPYMAEIAEKDIDIEISNKLSTVDGNYTLKLVMPDNYNHLFTDAATQSLHNYIVNYALADWFLLTNANQAAIYFDRAEAEITAARYAFNSRTKHIQRPLSTF